MFRPPMQARKDPPLNLCAVLVPLLCKEGGGHLLLFPSFVRRGAGR